MNNANAVGVSSIDEEMPQAMRQQDVVDAAVHAQTLEEGLKASNMVQQGNVGSFVRRGIETGSGNPSPYTKRAKPKRRTVKHAPQPDPKRLQKMTKKEVERALKSETSITEKAKKTLRKLWGSGSGSETYYPDMFDNSGYYNMWQQAYRLLGPYIDCDHQKSENSHDSGDNNNNDNDGSAACSRWSMWAAYYDPNYQGGGYYEYFGDDSESRLDCHEADTEWILIGVYREELYQWYEQISKHLWAIDEYDYVVALAGLAYMTDADCFYVGNDENGNYLYAGVQPLEGASIQMGLYSDNQCLELNTDTSYTYSTFVGVGDMELSSKDDYADDDATQYQSYQWWQDTQEYTLSNFNGVYDTFKQCTLCIDYPTYQDGFFIGDTGTDEDDLINQCWKFYSHDSFQCNGDCVAMASAQGTILQIDYSGLTFGEGDATEYVVVEETEQLTGIEALLKSDGVQSFAANAFIIASGIIFVGTFLAFAVARSNARSSEVKDKKYVLMDDYYQDPRDGRGKSRDKGRSSRSKSSRRRSSSRARSRRESEERRGSSTRSRSRDDRRSRSASRRESGDRDVDRERERRRRERARRERARRNASGEDGDRDGYRVSSRYDPPELTSTLSGEESPRKRSSSRQRSSSRRRSRHRSSAETDDF